MRKIFLKVLIISVILFLCSRAVFAVDIIKDLWLFNRLGNYIYTPGNIKVSSTAFCLGGSCVSSWQSLSDLHWTFSPSTNTLSPTTSTAGIVVNGTSTLATTTIAGSAQSGYPLTVNGESYFTKRVTINKNSAIQSAGISDTLLRINCDDNVACRTAITSYGVGGTNAFAGRATAGTGASPSASTANLQLAALEGWGYGLTGFSATPKVAIRMFASRLWTDLIQPTYMSFWTTDGSLVPSERMRITDDGKVLIGKTVTSTAMLDVAGMVSSTALTVNGYVTSTDIYLSAMNSSIANTFLATGEPTGFPNTTDSQISFTSSTRTFTIAPTSGSYSYWVEGKKFTTTTATSIQIPSTLGQLNLIYFDINGNLAQTTDALTFIRDGAQIATVYWDTNQGVLGYERHPITMDWATHYYNHTNFGVRYPLTNGGLSGSFLANNTFSIGAGEIHDEDNIDSVPATTTSRIFYRTGGTSVFNFTNVTSSWYYASGGNIYYDNSGNITAATNNNYVAYWVFATNDRNNPIYILMGQRQDNTLSNAQANNLYSNLSLGQMPLPEMKLLYRVIVRNNSPTFTVAETLDYRTSQVNGTTASASQHNLLSGLNWSVAGHTFDTDLNIGGYSFLGTGVSTTNATSTNSYISNALTVVGNIVADATTFVVDAVNNRVGIGTSTPSSALQVYNGGVTVDYPLMTEAYSSSTVSAVGAVYGKYAYVRDGNSIDIYSVANKTSPTWISSTDTGAAINNIINVGQLLYVSSGSNIIVYDLSNPVSLTVLSTTAVGGANDGGMAIEGNLLFVGARITNQELRIYDISNPYSLTLLSYINTNGGSRLYSLTVNGNYLYTGGYNTSSTFDIYDITNPKAPIYKGSGVDSYAGGTTRGLYITGRFLHVARNNATNEEYQIWDVSNPTSPTRLAYSGTPAGALGVFVSGKYAYISDSTSGIKIYDVSNPSSPVYIRGLSGDSANIYIQGKWLYNFAGTKWQIYDLGGIDATTGLSTGALMANQLNVSETAQIGNLQVLSGITAGYAGINTLGNISALGTSTANYLAGDLYVGGISTTTNYNIVGGNAYNLKTYNLLIDSGPYAGTYVPMLKGKTYLGPYAISINVGVGVEHGIVVTESNDGYPVNNAVIQFSSRDFNSNSSISWASTTDKMTFGSASSYDFDNQVSAGAGGVSGSYALTINGTGYSSGDFTINGNAYANDDLTVSNYVGIGTVPSATTRLSVLDGSALTYDPAASPTSIATFRNSSPSAYASIILQSTASGGTLAKQGAITVIDGDGANTRNSSMTFGLRDSATTVINEKMRLDYNGYLGVGTTSPQNFIHVFGDASAKGISVDGTTNPAISLLGNGTINGYIGSATAADAWFTGAAIGDVALRSISGKKIFIGEVSKSPMVLTNGLVGIGTTTPQTELSVVNTTGEGDITIGSATNNDVNLRYNVAGENKYNIYYDASANALAFYDNASSTQRMTIDVNGVSILGVSPAYPLDVNGVIRGTSDLYLTRNLASGPYFGTLGNFPLRIGVSTTEMMRVLTSGNVGIGTSTPNTVLSVYAANATADLFRVGTTTNNNLFILDKAGLVGIGAAISTTNAIITKSGAKLTIGGVWTNASDKNMKENFKDINGKDLLDKLMKLPITMWNYKSETDSTTHIGPVAQDFFRLFGVGGSNTSISTIDPAGIALKAIQYIQTEIIALQQKNDAQDKKIKELEDKIKTLTNKCK